MKNKRKKQITTCAMEVTQTELNVLSQAPVYYAAMLLITLPPTSEREEVLDMLELMEKRFAALTLQESNQSEIILFYLSPHELYMLSHAVLGYLALDAPGTDKATLLSFADRLKPFLHNSYM